MDLIDLDYARQHIPTSQDTDEPTISTLITSASSAVRKYCRRDFIAQYYDELYNGNGDRRLILREYPLISITSVRYRPVTVLYIQNTNTGLNQQARVTVTPTGLTLYRNASGVPSTDASVTFASYVTVQAVANAVTALGNGWTGQTVATYNLWPSADIYCPNGIATASNDYALPNAQGALTAAGQNAELKMHTYELAGYQLDARRGWLLRAIPYTDPELLHPEDLIFPPGINNFRVQYTAGYATIPEDVQEATAQLVASWFVDLGKGKDFQSEHTQGAYSYTIAQNKGLLPDRIRAILRPYRNQRIANNQS